MNRKLTLQSLSVDVDDAPLFDPVSVTVSGGELLQVCGPNGVGKTTLLRAIAGIITANTGTIAYEDDDPHAQTPFAYIGHKPAIQLDFTPEENLEYYAALMGGADMASPSKVLADWGLSEWADQPAHQLSAGLRRRVALARLQVGHQPVWLLDEPFSALDTQSVTRLQQVMQDHAKAGGIVIFTSHQLSGLTGCQVIRYELSPGRRHV